MDINNFPTLTVNEQPGIGVSHISVAHHSHHEPKRVTLEMIHEELIAIRQEVSILTYDTMCIREDQHLYRPLWFRFKIWLKKIFT